MTPLDSRSPDRSPDWTEPATAAPPAQTGRSPAVWVLLGAALLLLLAARAGGGGGWQLITEFRLPQSPPAAAQAPAPIAPVDPVGLRIPALGVEAPVIRLGLAPDRSLEVPRDAAVTGWWSGGARPGARGPAVIVGHIDSRTGPGVFADLPGVEAGTRIDVVGRDGRVASFVVDRVEQHAKDRFPTDAVYGDTPGPELRLVTCGGRFDRRSGHYDDNIIVFATPLR